MKLLMSAGIILSLSAFAAALPPGKDGRSAVRRHKVAAGETLWGLSIKYYGDPSGWRMIHKANQNRVPDPGLINTGEELEIPETAGSAGQAALLPAEAAAVFPVEKAAAAARPADTVKPHDRAFEELSMEMPADQAEFPDGRSGTAPPDWKEDGVIVSRVGPGDGNANDSLTAPGDSVRIKAGPQSSFQPGAIIYSYMKGKAVYDKKTRRRIGLELHRTGTLKVLSVEKNSVTARILKAVTSVDSGQVVTNRWIDNGRAK